MKGNCKLSYMSSLRCYTKILDETKHCHNKIKGITITAAHKTRSRTSHKKAEQMPANNNHEVADEEFKRKLSIFQEALWTADACAFTNGKSKTAWYAVRRTRRASLNLSGDGEQRADVPVIS